VSADSRLRVLALVPYPLDTTPSQRFRLEQWAPYLWEQGIELTFRPFASPALARFLYRPGFVVRKATEMLRCLLRRVADVRSAPDFDAAIVHREACLVGPAWVERRIARRVPFLFDFDDAIWLPNVSDTNRRFSFLKQPAKTGPICRMATGILAGNDHLADYAKQHNESVTVVPTTVSLRSYQRRASTSSAELPVVGWSGSHSSAAYLSLVTEALSTLRRRHAFRVLVIGTEGISIPGVDVECRPWRGETEVQDLSEIDVGLMPIPDDQWARGKCALKAIQYMGLGIPAVVSPVGANVEVVEHGRNGLLASAPNEWVDALSSLVADPERRRQLGAEARKTVEERYSAEVQAPRVAAALREAAATRVS